MPGKGCEDGARKGERQDMGKAHFKVRDEDLRGAYKSLVVASGGFESTTRITEDLRAEVGHAGLGDKLVTFADEWAIARENLVKDMDALSSNLLKILQMTDDYDNGTQEQQVDASGGSAGSSTGVPTGVSQPSTASGQTGTSSPAAQQLVERYRTDGDAPAGAAILQGDPRQNLREQLQASPTATSSLADPRTELRGAVAGGTGGNR